MLPSKILMTTYSHLILDYVAIRSIDELYIMNIMLVEEICVDVMLTLCSSLLNLFEISK